MSEPLCPMGTPNLVSHGDSDKLWLVVRSLKSAHGKTVSISVPKLKGLQDKEI
jgi:hypothetical protein